MVIFQRFGWREPGTASEAAREGWRLTTRIKWFQQDVRELLPANHPTRLPGRKSRFFFACFGTLWQFLL